MFYPRYFRQRVQCISRGVSDSYSSGIATPPNRIGKKSIPRISDPTPFLAETCAFGCLLRSEIVEPEKFHWTLGVSRRFVVTPAVNGTRKKKGRKKKNKKKTNHPKAHCSFLSPLLHGKFDIAVVEPNFKKRSCAWTCSVVPATFASPLVFQNVKQWRSCPGRRLTLRCASCHDTRPLNRNGISTSPRALFIVAKKKKTNTYGIFA